MNQILNQLLPRRIVTLLRDMCLVLLDVRDRFGINADTRVPPRSLHHIGDGDFRKIGCEFFNYFRTLSDLSPSDNVLDVGCGTGRMAFPLVQFLEEEGSYTGFDISPRAIRWCEKHISLDQPHMRFVYADIFNKEYNPNGKTMPAEYTFPCEDESIEFVFATSVFTHMYPSDVRHYLDEINRVLKPGGRCLLTFYLLNEESRRCAAETKPAMDFCAPLEDCFSIDAKTPERAIAFTEDFLRGAFADAALRIREPLHFGSWCGRDNALSGQDIVVATK